MALRRRWPGRVASRRPCVTAFRWLRGRVLRAPFSTALNWTENSISPPAGTYLRGGLVVLGSANRRVHLVLPLRWDGLGQGGRAGGERRPVGAGATAWNINATKTTTTSAIASAVQAGLILPPANSPQAANRKFSPASGSRKTRRADPPLARSPSSAARPAAATNARARPGFVAAEAW